MLTTTLSRRRWFVAASISAVVGSATLSQAADPSRCTSDLYGALGKRVAAVAKCYSKGVATGEAIDADCLTKAESRYLESASRAEGRGDCIASTNSSSPGASARLFLEQIIRVLDPSHAGGQSQCTGKKLAALGKAASSILRCQGKAAKGGVAVDPSCVSKAHSRMSGQWSSAEGIGDCLGSGDLVETADMVDALVVQLSTHLAGNRVKRGLAVVADFADSALETYASPPSGTVTSEKDFREILTAMTDHWYWMSVGTEYAAWDVVRITLDQANTAPAFPGWSEYRTAVITKVLQQVNVADYDTDSDGLADMMFVIASTHGSAYGYTIGGASAHRSSIDDQIGAHIFVDPQDSGSVRGRSIPAFNHETGHCYGLPDEYGPYDNLNFLTIMAYPYFDPPFGFNGWDRYRLGWLAPTVVSESTAGLELHPAETNLEAVLIPTARSTEYFVVEYRKRPASGYGTGNSTQYDGLAIYHVWETAGSNYVTPGLIALEPPDGDHDFGSAPSADDFWSAANPIASSFSGKAYYNTAEPIVEIGNFVSTMDGGIGFDVVLHEVATPSHDPDPLVNGDFELGSGNNPTAWTSNGWMPGNTTYTWEQSAGYGGTHAVRLQNTSENDAWYEQTITGLTTGERYRVSGRIKVDSITMGTSSVGANLSLIGTYDHSSAINQPADWTSVSFDFTATGNTATVGCRLGFWSSTVVGSMLCDDLDVQWVFE